MLEWFACLEHCDILSWPEIIIIIVDKSPVQNEKSK